MSSHFQRAVYPNFNRLDFIPENINKNKNSYFVGGHTVGGSSSNVKISTIGIEFNGAVTSR